MLRIGRTTLLVGIVLLWILPGWVAGGEALDLRREDPLLMRNNVALALSGAKADLRSSDGKLTPLQHIIDGRIDDEFCDQGIGVPVEFIVTFARPETIDTIRIFPGQVEAILWPAREGGVRGYRLQGYADHRWSDLVPPVERAKRYLETDVEGPENFYYLHRFAPVRVEKVRLVVTRPGDTGCRMRSPYKPVLDTMARFSRLREIEVFATDRGDRVVHLLNRLIETDFHLPAYLNRDEARLMFRARGSLKAPLDLDVSFENREGGLVPAPPLHIRIKPRDRGRALRIPIADWPDGEYVTRVSLASSSAGVSTSIVRLLRKQTIAKPIPPAEPIDVRGHSLLFVDDWYVKSTIRIERKTYPGELFPVSRAPIAPGRVIQYGSRVSVDADGRFVVDIRDQQRSGGEQRRYRARSTDLVDWEIVPNKPQAKAKGQPVPAPPASAAKTKEDTYRLYDPQKDGPVNVRDVAVRYTYGSGATWGEFKTSPSTAYPIWHKAAGEYVILRREPLTRVTDLTSGKLDTWRDAHDNFAWHGGAMTWHSRDGKTVFYGQARYCRRFPPYQVLYDNKWKMARILVIWRSTDGLTWTPTYFNIPDESDPPGYQQYGAQIIAAEQGNLWIAIVYAYNAVNQQIFQEIYFSRDSVYWERFAGHPPLVKNGPMGSWNFGAIFTQGPPLERDGFRYDVQGFCEKFPHFVSDYMYHWENKEGVTAEWLRKQFGWRRIREWPFWSELGSWKALADYSNSQFVHTIGLMRTRKDGWASLSAGRRRGLITTRTLRLGNHLAINARTAPGGSVRIELLDAEGIPVEGYAGKRAAVFEGDEANHRLAWGSARNTVLPTHPVRLRITMRKADVFALYASD